MFRVPMDFYLEFWEGWFWDCTFIRNDGYLRNAFTDWNWCSDIRVQLYGHFGMKPILNIAYSPTGQAIIKWPNRTLKKNAHRTEGVSSPKDGLKCALVTKYFKS